MYEFNTYMPVSVIYLHLCTEMAEIGVIEDTCRQCIVTYINDYFVLCLKSGSICLSRLALLALNFSPDDNQ